MSATCLKNWLALGISACLLSGCASPLFVGNDNDIGPGTVPRDEMGEPVWDQINPQTNKD